VIVEGNNVGGNTTVLKYVNGIGNVIVLLEPVDEQRHIDGHNFVW